jgi:hypothetical protein
MNVKIVIMALFIGTLLACNKGGDNSSPALVSIAITPSNSNVLVGNTQQFTAMGTYSDNSTTDLTSSATWTSSDTNVATVSPAGLVSSLATGSAMITAASGTILGQATLSINPMTLTAIKTVEVTTTSEGGSARPEMIATTDRLYVVYLGNIGSGTNRTFNVKIFDANLDSVVTSTTIVSASAQYGSPTDIRIAKEGLAAYAFYETVSNSSGTTYLWGAKYALNDTFATIASTKVPIATSTGIINPPDCHEILNDPAPLIGPNDVFVVTRYDCSLTTTGSTRYHVRGFNKDSLALTSSFDLDLSAAADGRGRVASLVYWNNRIYMALATTISNTGILEQSDDSAASDIVLVTMNGNWTFDPLTDVRTISSDQTNDRENYITGLRTDGTYFYMTYKQTVPGSLNQPGQANAVIKIYDMDFNLLHKEIVKSTTWPGGGEIRPSQEVYGATIYSGQDDSASAGTPNAAIYVYQIQ